MVQFVHPVLRLRVFAAGNRWYSLFILSLGDGCLLLVIGGAVCSSCP